jgi:hypothetical protein
VTSNSDQTALLNDTAKAFGEQPKISVATVDLGATYSQDLSPRSYAGPGTVWLLGERSWEHIAPRRKFLGGCGSQES